MASQAEPVSLDASRFILESLEVFESARSLWVPRSTARSLVQSVERISLLDGNDVPDGRRRQLLRAEVVRRLDPDPLRRSVGAAELEPVHAFMPTHEKDAWLAHLSVASVRGHSGHPLRTLTLCIPDGQAVPDWAAQYDVTVLRDSEVLARLGADPSRIATKPGWFIQQALKLIFALTADAPTLIHDADTVLLQPRVWLAAGVQILPVRRKSPKAFARSSAQFLARPTSLRYSSSVTHFQLMQPRVLQTIFGSGDEAMRRLVRWIEGRAPGREPSEYQLYASQLRTIAPRGWVPAGWRHAQGRVSSGDVQGRSPLSPQQVSEVLAGLQDAFPDLYGLTIHARG